MANEPPSLLLPSAPYRGIEPFRFVDQPIFSARTDEVRKLVRLITIYRGIFFYGESGAGKSSLINAGLIPALRNEGFAPERVRVQPIGGHELVVERIALTDEGTSPFLPSRFAASANKKTTEPARVVLSVEEFVRCIGKAPMPQRQDGISTLVAVPVLFFDQFEELVTLFEEAPDSREKFNQAREIQGRVVEMLLGLLDDPNLSIKLVLSFREDYLAKVSRRLAAAPQLGEQAFRLISLPETVLRKIIRGPFESASIPAGHFTRRLSELAFDALESSFKELSDTGTINLTEVQIACLALWENEEEEKAFLKEREHREAVRRLFGNYLDRALNRLEHKFRKPAITALTFLVTSSGTRNIVSEDDLLGNVVRDDHLTEPDAREVLKALSRTTRLVFRQTRGDSAFYEISSEFLIPWIAEKRQARERDAQLEKQREQQERQKRELAQAQALATEQKKRADDQAKAAARQRRLTMAMVIVSLVVVVAAVFSFLQRNAAKKAASDAIAATSRGNVSIARYLKESGRSAEALAQVAQALRLNSENREAAGLTAAMLTRLSWHVPLTGSIRPHAEIGSVQLSPDGQRVVTISKDMMQVWDATNGKPIGEPMKHEDVIFSAQFSSDSQRLVTISKDMMQVWDAASGKRIGEPFKGAVSAAEFSPDGQRVVTTSADKAQVWDAASAKPIGEPMKPEAGVNSAQFSPDGQRVVTVSGNKTARVWDATTGEPVGEPMESKSEVNSVRLSPDGQWVVTASGDTAQLWDTASGKPIGEPMKHQNRVESAQFSPDGQEIVTASWDNTARLWDAASGKPIGQPMEHRGPVVSAQFSPDGQQIVTGSVDKTSQVWDATNGKPIGESMKHEDVVFSAQFSPDGQRVVTGSLDKTSQVWDAAGSKPVSETKKYEGLSEVQFSPNGQQVITALGDTAQLWDAASSTPIGEPMKHQNVVNLVQFSPDGQRVVTASGDTAQLWDTASSKPIGEPMKHADRVASAQFSLNSQRVVTSSGYDTWQLWDAASGKPVGELTKYEGYSEVQLSPDGQRVVTRSGDKAQVWDVAKGEPMGEPMTGDMVYSAKFSPDGQRVVTTSGDTAQVWDAASGKPVGQPMKHPNSVDSAHFSPDSQRIVTTSNDNMARLWDAASGKPIGQPMKHEHHVFSAQFSRDSQWVVTASADKTARLWSAATGKPIAEPMEHKSMVFLAQFTADSRVLTSSQDETVRMWDAVIVTEKDTREDILLLAELAEVTGGVALETLGQAENLKLLTPEQIRASRGKIAAKFMGVSEKLTPLQRSMKWSISDHKSRTISPFSKMTVFEWLENRIKEGTIEGLRAALQVDPANARITAHLGRRLADLALKQGGDPDEARRARGQADFLTSRAQKLAPDSDEVKKLRVEVVTLLKLKTN
jgi:WD40 repeat protein